MFVHYSGSGDYFSLACCTWKRYHDYHEVKRFLNSHLHIDTWYEVL